MVNDNNLKYIIITYTYVYIYFIAMTCLEIVLVIPNIVCDNNSFVIKKM